MSITQIFAIDGSGDKNRKAAELKRPIYRWDASENQIRRVHLKAGQSAGDFFADAIRSAWRWRSDLDRC